METKKNEQLKELWDKINLCGDQQDSEGVFLYAKKLYAYAKMRDNKEYLMIACFHLGNSYYKKGKYEDALNLALEGLDYAKSYSYPKFEISLNNLAAIVYGVLGYEIMTIEYILNAYYLAVETKNKNIIYIIHNNLGDIFQELGYYQIALDYFLLSFEERNIEERGFVLTDGFVIVNILLNYVYQEDMIGYEKWLPIYEDYHSKFDSFIVETDYILAQAYITYQKKDIEGFSTILYNMIQRCQQENAYLHAFKQLVKIFNLSIALELKQESKDILKELKIIIDKHPRFSKHSALLESFVKYYQTFKNEEKLQEALLAYYESKETEDEIARQTQIKCAMTKIEMEQLLYEKNIILKDNEELCKRVEIEEFTNVLQKGFFIRHVKEELQNYRYDEYVSLFVIDIDRFKDINDTHGHMFGDKVLLSVVDILKKHVREGDYIGRIGGDEFAIYMKNILSIKYIVEKAELIIHDLSELDFNTGNQAFGVSIGICYTKAGNSYENIFIKADKAMYDAKNAGGSQFCIMSL